MSENHDTPIGKLRHNWIRHAIMDTHTSGDHDMQLIGSFLRCASRGDKVGLNQMLMEGISPDVQDYDKRTALHLAASEGHASIVELLIQYNVNVNLEDRWQRTNFNYEHGLNEVNIDPSELQLEHSSEIQQSTIGKSEKVKWRGTWVVKTIIKISDERMRLSDKEMSRLRELRHPNILQFLGAIMHDEEMILITEYLSKGNLNKILREKLRLDIFTFLRYALDIASNLLLDEGGHLKIGDYWAQMIYEKIHPHQEIKRTDDSGTLYKSVCDSTEDIRTKDVRSYANVLYEMLEGRLLIPNDVSSRAISKPVDTEPKFKLSRCPVRIQQ
ncbi:Serine/threonine-protein kinase CTR1 [Acorus calamus]|uniref:Serine/threonine-protein kinase CTR1 n=1 Tax=Acorus calamus TaxID=4465 RepID=A0AAV9FML6_ACOCL|nr:Serine/threonine-protein kinase CTR1 [Acorus calamus]